jgi:hypothetical protein
MGMTRRTMLTALGGMPLMAADLPRTAPEFEVALTNGRKLKISDYKGKVLVFAGILTT